MKEELKFNTKLPSSPSLKSTTPRQTWTQASGEASTHLQTDRQVDPAAEGGADGSGVEAQVLKEFGEGLRQRRPGTLLSYHHTRPDPGQVQPSRLKIRKIQHQTWCEQLYQSFSAGRP